MVSSVMGMTGDQGHIEADKAASVHSLLASYLVLTGHINWPGLSS